VPVRGLEGLEASERGAFGATAFADGRARSPGVVLVDEQFVQRYFAKEMAIGARVRDGKRCQDEEHLTDAPFLLPSKAARLRRASQSSHSHRQDSLSYFSVCLFDPC
jgi:hypothetical protein